jgi:DNA-binding NtrC family response regulator
MSKPTVLFVDDEPNVLNAWKRAFQREPYSILTARSGTEAISILRGLRVGAVVSDFSMSPGNGIELLQQVREQYPDTPRIMISGNATLAVAQDAINSCGVIRFLQKPCSTIDLGIAIREALMLYSESRTVSPAEAESIRLERKHPGITRVDRDHRRRITIDLN